VTQRPTDGMRPWPEVHGLILDLDGTVYRGDLPLPGAFEALARWRELGIPMVFVTNNATQSRGEFAAKLTRLGCEVGEEQIVNSAHATGQVLRERYPAGTPVYVVGAPALARAVTEAGFEVTDRQARVVVVGLDRAFTYDKLRTAIRLILAGADFIQTNPDRLIPHGDQLDPGAGTLMAAVHAGTAHVTSPVVIGKPESTLITLAMRVLGTQPGTTVMVGDQLETDVQAGQRAGLFSVLVTTGVPRGGGSPIVPDRVIGDLREIPVQPASGGIGGPPT
jgi:4-nitrophenyl phosphatase